MKRIAILSDTHSFIDSKITNITSNCDEIWHAGDFGHGNLIEDFIEKNHIKGVYGNIDGSFIRNNYSKYKYFKCEGFQILITHIGGKPYRYNNYTNELIKKIKPNIFITGHSHILKISQDKINNLTYINPGAAGKEGIHKIRTVVLITLHKKKIQNMEVVELGKRSQLS